MRSIAEVLGLLATAASLLTLLRLGLAPARGSLLRLAGLLACLAAMAVGSSSLAAPVPGLALGLGTLGALAFLAWAPALTHGLVGLPMPRPWAWAYGAVFGLGAGFAFLPHGSWNPLPYQAGLLFATVTWCVGIAAYRARRGADALVRRFLRRFFLLSLLALPFLAADSLGSALGWAWIAFFDGFSLPAYLGAISVLILLELGRWTQPLSAPPGVETEREAAEETPPEVDVEALPQGGPPASPWSLLSPREAEIARLVLEGAASKEIAGDLGLSPRTVENHVYRIFGKVGARTRLQLYRILGPEAPRPA